MTKSSQSGELSVAPSSVDSPRPGRVGLCSRLAWIPLPLFLAATAILLAVDHRYVFAPPWLAPGIFNIGVSILATIMAVQSYRAGGARSILLLGCGMLGFGLAFLAGSALIGFGHRNAGVTAHNLGMLLAGACQLIGALDIWRGGLEPHSPSSRRRWLLMFYGACLAMMALITLAAWQNLLPVFLTSTGTTPLRTAVLTATILAYFLSALLFALMGRQTGIPFLRWYWLGLALMAVGLLDIALESAVGSPLCWAGRAAQCLGQAYVVICLLVLMKRHPNESSPAGRRMALSFGQLERMLHQSEELARRHLEELTKSERRYRLLFDRNPDGVFTVDPLGRFTLANPACQTISGYSPAELLEKTFLELCAPDQLEKTLEQFLLCLHDPVYRQIETALIHKDGRRVELWISGEPIIADGQVVAVHCTAKDITERKRADERFRTLAQASFEGIVITESGIVVEANEQFARMHGYELSDVIGLPAVKFLAPGEHERMQANLLSNENRYDEYRDLKKDGSIIHVEAHGRPLLHERRQRRVTVLRDITERKKREAELLRLHRTLKALSASNQALMRATDEEQYLQDVCRIVVEDCGHTMVWIGYTQNDEAKTVLPVAHAGLDEGYLQAKTITWADTPRGRGPTGTAIRTGQPITCRNMLTDPAFAPWRAEAMKRGYASSLALPLMSEGSAFGSLTIYSREVDSFSQEETRLLMELAGDLAYGITSLRLRAALRQSEERYRSLFSSMTEGFALHEVICDDRGQPCDYRFLDINPAFEQLTGLKRQNVIGRTLKTVLPDEDPRWIQTYGQVALTGQSIRFEQTSAALGRHFEVFAYRPAPRQFAVVFTDITSRKRTEEMLLAAKTTAEQANKAKDQFLAVLSHELRTPLNPVLLTASLLEHRTDLPADVQADVQSIRRNVQLEARIIDDLLDLTRITQGKLQYDFQPTDVHLLLRSAADICGQGEGARILLDLQAQDHQLLADPARLQQVFWNLLTNARKFTPADGTITVRTRNPEDLQFANANLQLKDGKTSSASSIANCKSQIANPLANPLVLEFIDTGAGIRPEFLPRIFDAFEQDDPAKARQFGGLGLGLAISRAITEAHNGRITVSSAGIGHGSTFTVVLPGCTGSPPLGMPSPDQPQLQIADRKLQILLVEDHPSTLAITARLLRRFGHDVHCAGSMAECLSLAGRQAFDLVISDLGLPDGSGHDLMRQLKQRHGLKGIAISGYGMAEDLLRSQEAGFVEHLTKPLDLAKLEAAIQRTCKT